jgi:hypothetical protein
MGLTIEETLLTKEMMLVSFLQILGICYMNLMNLWFSPHKFSMCLFGVSPRHHGRKLFFVENLEVGELWQTHTTITWTQATLFLALKPH